MNSFAVSKICKFCTKLHCFYESEILTCVALLLHWKKTFMKCPKIKKNIFCFFIKFCFALFITVNSDTCYHSLMQRFPPYLESDNSSLYPLNFGYYAYRTSVEQLRRWLWKNIQISLHICDGHSFLCCVHDWYYHSGEEIFPIF